LAVVANFVHFAAMWTVLYVIPLVARSLQAAPDDFDPAGLFALGVHACQDAAPPA
jgi:hypothetical protein